MYKKYRNPSTGNIVTLSRGGAFLLRKTRQRKMRRGKRRSGYIRTGGFYGRFRRNLQNNYNPELKFHDTDISKTNITSAFGVTNIVDCLNVVAQGDTQSSRDGRRIWVKSIHLSGVFYGTTSGVELRQRVRVILYLDTQCNGAAITGVQLLQAFNCESHRAIEHTSRIKVLSDKIYAFPPVGTFSTAVTQIPGHKQWRINKNCNIPIDYDSTAATGALTTVRANNLGVIFVTGTSTDTAQLAGICRIRFGEQ